MSPLFLAFIMAMFIAGVSSAQHPPQDTVILIHGLGRTAVSLKLLEWNLNWAGYRVVNVSYPSRRYDIPQLAEEYLGRIVAAQNQSGPGRIHFVTHSLGGIVLRQYLTTHTVTNLGRVVMLAPPNHGSEVADKLKQSALGRWILGPAGCQLGTSASDWPAKLGATRFPLGVIAGDRSADPWFSGIFKRENDGKVAVESTKLDGMADFLVMHSSHTWLMWRNETVRQVLTFLAEGRFAVEKSSMRAPTSCYAAK